MKNTEGPVTWLGNRINQIDGQRKSENYYLKFKFGSIVASVGDFVLVSNADAVDPDTVDGSDVAKILHLYQSETDKDDPYRAVVQWYTRVRELPKIKFQFDDWPVLCQKYEVFEETRPYLNDISIETVFCNCRVVFILPIKDPKEAAREEKDGSLPLFVCRFRLICRNRRNMTIEPVSIVGQEDSSIGRPKRSRQRVFQFGDDFVCDSFLSPGKHKLNTPDKIQSPGNDSINGDDSQIIRHNFGSKETKLSSKNNSNHTTPKGIEIRNNSHRTKGLKSSDRKRKTCDELDDSDAETRPMSGHKLKTPRQKPVSSSKKSSSKSCSYKHSTPSGNLSHRNSKKVSVSRVRRKLSIELEGTLQSQCVGNDVFSNSNSDSDENTKLSTPKRKSSKTPSTNHTPSMPERKCSVSTPSTVLEEARSRLHVSAVPQELPCRELEFQSVCHFVHSKVLDNVGGCMYISGVPGTGKTATVHEVLNYLQREVDANKLQQFKLVKLNGMQLTDPRQAYVEILHQLTGQKMKSQQAQQILEKRFKTPAPRRTMTVLVVDELDLLCTRRQDVVYNLLDWPNYRTALLVVITIANTMDLPERCFINRVNSRMGLTRVTFQPYSYVQLQKIVMSRLDGLNAFDPDAVQLIARKVAAVSGDARRALDMCRRATEISSSSGQVVTMGHVNQVLQEMITSPKILAIRSCSVLEQAFLRATAAEVSRTGVEETVFNKVYQQLSTLCIIDNLTKPSLSQTFGLCARLGACRLLLTEHSTASIYQRIIMNVSVDDVHYATSQHASEIIVN